MNVLVLMAAILFILMVLIGGKKGARSFISLFFNFGVFIITIFFMLNTHNDPIILTMMACTGFSCNLFYINHVNRKTTTAFISTLITMAILLLFIDIVTKVTMIQGFGEEQFDEQLAPFSLYIGVDFVKIAASVIIMSTIGAITEVAISITSSMGEILNNNPSISRKALFLSGLRIGKDILGTDTNTLFFAFYGGYIALLLWFKDLSYSVGKVVNSKLFCAELVTIFCAGIGIALIIPIASWINASFSVKTRDK